MITNNICLISCSSASKNVLVNNIIEKYTPPINITNIKQFLESTEHYFSINFTNNHINLLNTINVDDVSKLNQELDRNIKIIHQSSSVIFLLDCNSFKNKLIEQYYYIIYTLGIKNIAFVIYNLEYFPLNDRDIRLKDFRTYLTKTTKKIGIKNIKIMTIEEFDFTPLLLNKQINKINNYNSIIIDKKFNHNNNYDVINGTVNSGIINRNDVLCIKPNNIVINVKKIEIDHIDRDSCHMYDKVGLLVEKNETIKEGDLLVNFNSEIKKTNKLLCKIIVIEDVINVDDSLIMYYNQNKIECSVNCIYKNLRLNISNKDSLPLILKRCKVGIICVDLADDIYINKFNDDNNKEGRLIFTNSDNKLSCIGIIKVIK